MKFIHKIRTKWSEVDPMYFVRTEVYIDYYREAGSELMRSIGFSYDRFEKEGFQLPILEVNCNYYKPLCYDENIEIETCIIKLKDYQMVALYEIYNNKRELTSSGKITYGILSKKTNEPEPMPAELKEKLQQFVEKENKA